MNYKIHGVVSLIKPMIAIGLSAILIYKNSIMLGTLFVMFCGIISIAILRLFCAKCPSRDDCSHVLPGLALKKIFKTVKSAPNSLYEIIFFVIGAGIIIICLCT
jgi:hypothetical protein